jgi:hypothetical protein
MHCVSHHGIRRSAEPRTRDRGRDAAIRGEAELPRASNAFPSSMVIALLPATCSGHAAINAGGSASRARRGLAA